MKTLLLKFLWVIVVLLALLVGYIPVSYLMYGVAEGYLELKSQAAIGSKVWWFFLYTHMIWGGLAIVIGWIQFNRYLQNRHTGLHRTLGKIYFVAALVCAVAGFYLSLFATGGWIPALGFLMVSVLYFYTTLQGYTAIRNKRLAEHRNFMTYSYALCLSAVNLRLAIPISYLFTDDYIFSYSIIAWAAWIPNLVIAYWINRGRSRQPDVAAVHSL